MQISQSQNQTSFGIRSISFDTPYAKSTFKNLTKNFSSEKMTQLLEDIKNIKPKVGPDIDAFITNVPSVYSFSKERPFEGLQQPLYTKFLFKEKVTPKSILKAFKNLVKNVDASRIGKNVSESGLGECHIGNP